MVTQRRLMMRRCPTLTQLLELELRLFEKVQSSTSVPEAEWLKMEVEWNNALAKARALGGKSIYMLISDYDNV